MAYRRREVGGASSATPGRKGSAVRISLRNASPSSFRTCPPAIKLRVPPPYAMEGTNQLRAQTKPSWSVPMSARYKLSNRGQHSYINENGQQNKLAADAMNPSRAWWGGAMRGRSLSGLRPNLLLRKLDVGFCQANRDRPSGQPCPNCFDVTNFASPSATTSRKCWPTMPRFFSYHATSSAPVRNFRITRFFEIG